MLFGFLAISKIEIGLDFLGQCEHSGVGEAHERRTAAVTSQEEIYLFELPAVRHGGHHLCQLLLLALQHPVHMFHRNLRGGTNIREKGSQNINGGEMLNSQTNLFKVHRTACTCDVLQSRSLILSLMSFINDVML